MKVIGICGTIGSGKGTVVSILMKTLPAIHVSARAMIKELAASEGIDMNNRDDLRIYNEKRNMEGKSLIVDLEKKYNTPENENKYIIFESIRRVGEVNKLREIFGQQFLLISVNTPIETRYLRILSRNTETDHIDFETFKEHERLENISEDPNQMNQYKCIEMSDIKLENTSSMEDLEKEIQEKVLSNLFFALPQ